MRIYDIIKRKRDGFSLSKEEIEYFINGYTDGKIPDYQIASLLMAIFLNKMNDKETLYLTRAMVESGEKVDLSSIKGIKIDKHSTGGVGDSITLVLGPMIAACEVPFVKMSGRGLGHSGGTLDKLESINNFKVDISKEDFIQNTNKINISICSQTTNITPADKKLYALRDVTATVDNISLISSSIMSKKLAVNSNGIILDVKVGSGAFMKDLKEAKNLARTMVNIGKNYGRDTIAIVTNMDQPLGKAIGNNLEVKEAIETLKGKGPKDLLELALILGSKSLVLAKEVQTEKEGRKVLEEAINSGKAYNKFIELVKYQYGDIKEIENPDLFPRAKYIIEVNSKKEGFIKKINAEEIGKCALKLGAGRETLETEIDLSAGIILNKKVDDYINLDETLAYIHTNDKIKGEEVKEQILDIYIIGKKNIKDQKLILDEIY
ncbi:MAG: pyrimidine-nucleoside phosphorylase [Tissierella sp.]|uniref:pyrimidine-nucleoside phosphorylase n=1 Tax=Tissierella sp. TaxID=41274 RepID=UPI003F9E3E20